MTERIGIIGGGIVGIALARALAQAGTGDVTVFEKEHRLAAHQTGHNSGVVHAGLYYAEGSLKARLCVAGRTALRDFCLEKNLPYREAGKLVVAVDESELPALAEIERRSRANGVPGLARRFIPELTMADLTAKTASGVRAQTWDRDGSLLDDFAVDQVGPVTLLRNAPSPAATSCLAIADYLVEQHLRVRRP